MHRGLAEWLRDDKGIHDRTGSIAGPFDRMHTLYPIPWSGRAPTYEDACMESAQAIAREGRDVCVSWSGGVDSTLALLCLLDVGVRPLVLLTPRSILEYPWMYHAFFRDRGLETRLAVCSDPRIVLPDGCLIVTGEMNDKYFGGMKNLGYDPAAPLESAVPGQLSEWLEPVMRLSPRRPTTFFDWAAWLKFTMHWQHTSVRYYVGLSPEQQSRVRHFFGTDGHQRWYLANQERPAGWKIRVRDMILARTGDRDYHESKGKVGSLALSRSGPARLVVLMEDGSLAGVP
jgi:hypothetical protein